MTDPLDPLELAAGPADDGVRTRAPDRRVTIRQSLAVGLPTSLYGVSFGALSVAAGLSFWQTVALSALMVTGGSQFAFVGVIGAGGTGAAAVGASSLLGIRNAAYGLRLASTLTPRGLWRLLAGHLTIDESTAVSIAQPTRYQQRLGFWVTGATIFIGWNLTTAVGAVAGDQLGDPNRYGLDAMAAAAFLALLWPRLSHHEPQVVAVAAGFVAIVCLPFVPAGLPVVIAALVAVAASAVDRPGGPARQDGPA
jgi:predicted branched-subunit amino acid permease